jgi:uncharacterized membrane protein YcfT
MEHGARQAAGRVGWVDTAKGICIIMVVMVHGVLGVEAAAGTQGWMHNAVSFARPFRMPDFFLISGLFLGLVIDRPWLRYVDRKVVHFAYFYVLWLTIQFAFKAPGMALEDGPASAFQSYLLAFVQPFGTLWFVYLLPIFFLFTRLVRTAPVWSVFAWAAALEILPVHTDSIVFDEFCERFVYFYAGYAFAPHCFAFAAWVRRRPLPVLAAIALWAPLNGWLVFTPAPGALAPLLQNEIGAAGATGGVSELPVISLLLGFAGALVVVACASLVSGLRNTAWLTWLGAHSIVIYLAFFLPMAATRTVLLKAGVIADRPRHDLLDRTEKRLWALPVRAPALGLCRQARARQAGGRRVGRLSCG